MFKVKSGNLVCKMIALSLIVALLFTGCSSPSDTTDTQQDNTNTTDQNTPRLYDISMAGIGVGGAWASIGEGVLESIRRSYPGSNATYEAGQEGPNVALVSQGQMQLGIANSQLIQMAYEGTGPFEGKPMKNLRILATLYDDVYMQFVIRKETGITSFEDIKRLQYPLKINFNTKGSFMHLEAEEVLKTYGITVEDIESWGGKVGYMSTGDSLDQMRDGIIDAYSTCTQVPLSNFVDAALTMDLNILPVSDDVINEVSKALYTRKGVIPSGTYTFNDQDIPTLQSECVLFVNGDLPEDELYDIAKALSDNLEYLKGIHSSLKDLTLKELATIEGTVPLAPGAEKFYKEKGAL